MQPLPRQSSKNSVLRRVQRRKQQNSRDRTLFLQLQHEQLVLDLDGTRRFAQNFPVLSPARHSGDFPVSRQENVWGHGQSDQRRHVQNLPDQIRVTEFDGHARAQVGLRSHSPPGRRHGRRRRCSARGFGVVVTKDRQ